uniref:RNase H type-1 domain-containing protein n=1 Tax=Cannabis sativa TaxID=3483 RepID=A0A803PKA2_CANSA
MPAQATLSWSPPPEDWLKINCDVRVGSESMCVVALAKDCWGTVVWTATDLLDFADALIGEATTCLLALKTANLLKQHFVMIKSDSEIIINFLNGSSADWRIDSYVNQCIKLSKLFMGCYFSFISRLCHFAAYNVAN